MPKLWRYNGFDPVKKEIKTSNDPTTGVPWIYKKPEVFSETQPSSDYTEIEFPTASTKLRDKVLSAPLSSYRIYKYLTVDQALLVKDPTIPPHGLEYTEQIDPKMRKTSEVFSSEGFLTSVVWSIYDFENDLPVEEILKINIDYQVETNASLNNTAKEVLSRQVKRQWILESGSYLANESDAKITPKVYDTYLKRKTEGIRRRNNVIALGEERFVTLLVLLFTNGDKQKAEFFGQSILRKFELQYIQFEKTGDGKFMEDLAIYTNGGDLTDKAGNVIQVGVTAQTILDIPIPATVNLGQGNVSIDLVVPGASTAPTMRDFIINKYAGNI